MISLKHYKVASPSDVLLVSSTYQRDKIGSPTYMSWDNDTSNTSCSYDGINRLQNVTYPGLSQVTFGYDWVGNRTDTGWGAVNVVDQLPSSPGVAYTYDTLRGNLDTRTKNSLVYGFLYDDHNLLKQINWPNSGGSTQFVSDAAGNRVRMTTSGQQQYTFVYDTTAGIPAVLAEVNSYATRLYVRTPDGRLIAEAHYINGNTYLDRYYHFDALGNTRALTESTGVVMDRYSYDVWGNVTHDYGDDQQPYMFVGQLGYYTNYQDPMLDPFSTNTNKYVLLQLGVRYYDPSIGRFTQRDVIAGRNRYRYAADRVTSCVDPSGEWGWKWPGGWDWILPDPIDLILPFPINEIHKYYGLTKECLECMEFYEDYQRITLESQRLYEANISDNCWDNEFMLKHPNSLAWVKRRTALMMRAIYGDDLSEYIESCGKAVKDIVGEIDDALVVE